MYLVFLNFLNIRKDYYRLQQFALKPPNKNDTVSIRETASFLQKHFQEYEGFLEIFKKIFRINFPKFSLHTFLPLTINC